MNTESYNNHTKKNQNNEYSVNPIGLDDISNIPDNENYLADLKLFLKKHWSTVKEKLNEDVNLKVEYTGIGSEPFVELGNKIKNKLTSDNQIMILGQDKHGFPLLIEKKSKLKSIKLKGMTYNNKLDSYNYNKNDTSMNLIGSMSGHSIDNISKKNCKKVKAIIIYISLASNDPLDEFNQYIKMIENYNLLNAYILVAFIHEKLNQHNAEALTEAINEDFDNQVKVINIHAGKADMNSVFKLVGEKLLDNNNEVDKIIAMCESITSDS